MDILTTEEVANWLKVNIRTIQRLAQSKFYPQNVCFKVGHQYRFSKENLEKLLFSSPLEN